MRLVNIFIVYSFWIVAYVGINPCELNGQWDIQYFFDDEILIDVCFVEEAIGLVWATTGVDLRIHRTIDFGESWGLVYLEEGVVPTKMYFLNNNIGYCSSNENLLKTTDGGLSWSYINPEYEGYGFRGLCFEDEQNGFGCFADGGSGFMETHDGGMTWDLDPSWGGRDMIRVGECQFRVAFNTFPKSDDCFNTIGTSPNGWEDSSPTDIAYVLEESYVSCGIGINLQTLSNFGVIGLSENDGESWSLQGFTEIYALYSIVAPDSENIYAVGWSYDAEPGPFMKSIDQGNTWFYQGYDPDCLDCIGLVPLIVEIACPSPDVCYAISQTGHVFRTLNGGGELIPITSITEPSRLYFNCYPNPSDGRFIIELPSSFSGSLVVYNSLGEIVFSKHVYNVPNVEVNLPVLGAGVYVVRITDSTGQIARKRMVID